jgi:hypothetical protein
MDNENKKSLLESLESISEVFNQAMKEIEQDQEAYWNSLTEDQRLSVFCAVVRRIHKALFVKNSSYRGTLYDVFGFGMESYVQAQVAGYIDIHNLEYETVDECVSVVKNAVNQGIPASEYAELIKTHFENKRNETRNSGNTDF